MAAAKIGYALWARVEHTIPALRWIPFYVTVKWRGWLLHDFVASLALAALAAPEAISYASIAGMPGVNGLYSAYTAPIAYAIFGSSPQLVTGPTTLMSVLTLDAMEGTGTWAGKRLVPESPEYIQVTAFLAVVVGVQQLLLALVGGASLTALLSAPIISGFTTGSALIIGASQLSKIFGVPKCVGANGGSCSVQAAIANVVEHVPGMFWQTPVLSLSCIAFLVLWKYGLPRVLPRALRILGNAAPLLLMICTGAASYCMQKQFKEAHIALAKAMPSGVPAPRWPELPDGTTSSDVGRLFAHALQCSLIGYIGALSISRVVAREFGYAIDEQQELIAAGASNFITALARGFPVQASFSRTAVNVGSGGRSAMSGLISSAILMLICLYLTSELAWVPDAVLGSIVFVVIFRLIEVPEAVRMWKTDKRDLVVALVTFVVVSCSTVSAGLVSGVVLQWISGYTRSYALLSTVSVVEYAPDAVTGAWSPVSPQLQHTQSKEATNGGGRVAVLRFGGTDLQVRDRGDISIKTVQRLYIASA